MTPPRIHVHAAPADAFFVNSFLIEGDESGVVVDTQFLVSSAQALRRRLDSLGKPLAGVIVTHPHPDHYNGLPILLDGLPPQSLEGDETGHGRSSSRSTASRSVADFEEHQILCPLAIL